MKSGFLLLLALSFVGAGSAHAQQAGDSVVLLGYGHIITLDHSRPLHTIVDTSLVTEAAGIQSPFDSPGTASSVNDSDTAFFSLTHFFTDHIAVSTAGGIPAQFKLEGQGVIQPTGVTGALLNVNLGDPANNPLATVRQWTPAILAQYFFVASNDEIRPFVGLGGSYTWFTDVRLNANFVAASEANFGNVLAAANGKSTPTTVHGNASSSFQPLFNIGIQQRIVGKWNLTASATFALLNTKADIQVRASDGTVLADSSTRINIDPLALNIFIGYDLGPGIPFFH